VLIVIQDVVDVYVGIITLPNASEVKDVMKMLLDYFMQYVTGLVNSSVIVNQEIVQLIIRG
tara:strand:- start:2157 stop:2339 length:183 start_codon:yes stop_codon:yes gene_type:complete